MAAIFLPDLLFIHPRENVKIDDDDNVGSVIWCALKLSRVDEETNSSDHENNTRCNRLERPFVEVTLLVVHYKT